MTRPTPKSWLLAILVSSLGCGESNKSAEVQPEPVEPPSAGTTTTTGVAADATGTTTTTTTTGDVAPVPPVDVLGPWTVLFAYDVGPEQLEELRSALSEAGQLAEHEPLLVEEDDDESEASWLVAGLHSSEEEAKDAARKLGKKLARTALPFELPGRCQRVDAGIGCSDVSRQNPLGLWPLELRPSLASPPVERPVSPAITHTTPTSVIVVGSNLAFEPGKTSIDGSPKFRTWIWQPARGVLPTKGNVSGPAPAEGADPSTAPLVEEREGLWVAAGGRMIQLVVEDSEETLSRCNCDEPVGAGEDDEPFPGAHEEYGDEDEGGKAEFFDDRLTPGSGKVVVKSSEITLKYPQLVAIDEGERQLLVPFVTPDRAECSNGRTDVRADFQLVAVAGSLVFVAHRDRVWLCEGVVADLALELRVFDLAGGTAPTFVDLEAELDAAATNKAREKASKAIDELFALEDYHGPIDALWPEKLEVTAIFPRYREWKGGMEMLVQYGLECSDCYERNSVGGRMFEDVDWDSQWWVAREAIKYPASSRLAPPPEALALFGYVHRVHGNWKTFGWSNIPSDAAPAPSPSEPISPTPSEPTVPPPSEPPVQPSPSP